MKWDVIHVETIAPLALQVQFSDGMAGKVQFEPSHLTGVFVTLRDPAIFNQTYIDHGAVAWPGNLDLAPGLMYAAIKARGEWVLT
jgi:hypothetical protein